MIVRGTGDGGRAEGRDAGGHRRVLRGVVAVRREGDRVHAAGPAERVRRPPGRAAAPACTQHRQAHHARHRHLPRPADTASDKQ